MMGRLSRSAVYISLCFGFIIHVLHLIIHFTRFAGCVDVDTKRCRRESRRWERENSFANGTRPRLEEGFGISIESNGCSLDGPNHWSPNAFRCSHCQHMNETHFIKPNRKILTILYKSNRLKCYFLVCMLPAPTAESEYQYQYQNVNVNIMPTFPGQ